MTKTMRAAAKMARSAESRTFAEHAKAAREALGWSQIELGKRADVGIAAVGTFEVRNRISPESAQKIADALGINVVGIVDYTTIPEKARSKLESDALLVELRSRGLTQSQAAELLGVKASQMEQWLRRGMTAERREHIIQCLDDGTLYEKTKPEDATARMMMHTATCRKAHCQLCMQAESAALDCLCDSDRKRLGREIGERFKLDAERYDELAKHSRLLLRAVSRSRTNPHSIHLAETEHQLQALAGLVGEHVAAPRRRQTVEVAS